MEVSCKNTKAIFYGLEHYTDVPIERLVEGLPVTLEYLNNAKNKIDWAIYYQILERIYEFCPTEEALVQLGFDIVCGPNQYNRVMKLIGLAISPNRLYKIVWLWVARSEWPHTRFTYEELASNQVYLTWEIDDTEPMSMALHYITEGLLKGYPTLIGLPPASVKCEGTLYEVSYTITTPRSLTLWARLGSIFRVFRTSKVAIDELADQQLQIAETEKKFRAIAETAVDSIVMVDSDMNIRYWNAAAEKTFGYPSTEVIGQPHSLIMPERFRHEAKIWLGKASEGDRGSFRGQPTERIGLRQDGTEFPIEITVSRWKTDEGILFTAIIRDITRRKQVEEKVRRSEEQYRNLAQHLMTMQDDERSRLSRDLHDSLGQQLATLALLNGLVKKKVQSRFPEVVGDFNEINRLLKEAIEECHRLAFELTPPSFQRLGLASAVRETIEGHAQRTGIEVTFEESLNGKKLPEDVEISLFRILQEALSNIHNHASADKVEVRLFEDDGGIYFVVQDDGKGFDINKLDSVDLQLSKRGLGLLSMRERVKKFNGRFEIVSKVGEGTTVSVIIPDVEG